MKTIATLIFVLFIGVSSQAQNELEQNSQPRLEVSVKTDIDKEILRASSSFKITRLYKRTHTRVKKELNFSTKKNGAKMA